MLDEREEEVDDGIFLGRGPGMGEEGAKVKRKREGDLSITSLTNNKLVIDRVQDFVGKKGRDTQVVEIETRREAGCKVRRGKDKMGGRQVGIYMGAGNK